LSFAPWNSAVNPDYYRVPPESNATPVTFDRQTWEDCDNPRLVYLTFGAPKLASLRPRVVEAE
jgi:hypothetical protein